MHYNSSDADGCDRRFCYWKMFFETILCPVCYNDTSINLLIYFTFGSTGKRDQACLSIQFTKITKFQYREKL